jgi:hypothetical protein
MLDLVEEQLSDAAIEPPDSLVACLGSIHLQLHGLGEELLKRDCDQDAEKILQHLILISGAAMSAASAHVLPYVERGDR